MNDDRIDFGSMEITKLFRKMLIPTLFGMFFSATLTIADGIFVGQGVGSDGLAAVNIVAPLFMITAGIGLMFGVGASIVAAIYLSRKKIKAARINITQAFIVSSFVMLLISALMFFFHREVGFFFGSSEKLLPMVLDYMDWIVPFLVFNMIMTLGLFIIRLDGSPVIAMLCNLIPGLINIILCYIFVMKLGWGIKGSAIACSIGVIIGGVMVAVYAVFFSKTLRFFWIKASRTSLLLTLRNVRYMVKLGSSALIGELALASMFVIGNYVFIRALGEDGVAAFSIACYCFPLVFMINNAIAQSAQPIISFNHGCGNCLRVNKTLRLSVCSAILCGFVAMVMTGLFCEPLVALFLDSSSNAYNIAVKGMPYFALGFVFFAFNIVSIGYYQSIERARRATIYMVSRGFIFMAISFWALPYFLHERGIWLSVPFSEMLTSIFIVSLFLFRDLKAHRRALLKH